MRPFNALKPLVSLFLLVLWGLASGVWAKNGFDLSQASIPESQILNGGPSKDGIPSIDKPVFLSADKAAFVNPEDKVLGVYRNGIAKAYPVSILNWHEVVNDQFAGEPVTVTYCPLCGTGMAFSASVGDRTLTFGVSGLLYQSDVLLYDRQTESLWSQLLAEAVSGPMQGTRLEQLVLAHTSWRDWSGRYPDSMLLSRETGNVRDYGRNPYAGYEQSEVLYFPVNLSAPPPYHPKELVLGLKRNGKTRAYPLSELSRLGSREFKDHWNAETLIVHWNPDSIFAEIRTKDGALIPTTIAYWFAWHTFFPDSEIFKASAVPKNGP